MPSAGAQAKHGRTDGIPADEEERHMILGLGMTGHEKVAFALVGQMETVKHYSQ
jgi:hypothetical protein